MSAPGAARGVPRGRRPGAPETRSAILDAARASFAEVGFQGTTIRAVAASAGVDPALVHHYFGTKDALFMAALQMPVDPRALLAPVIAEGPDGAGERLLTTFLAVWDDPELQPALLALARSVVAPGGGRLLTDGFLPVVIRPMLAPLAPDRAEVRIPLVASQLLGLIVARYLLAVEPLASMPAADVVATVGPTLQRYLTGELALGAD